MRQARLHVHCYGVHNVLYALLSSSHPHRNTNYSRQRSRNKHCARPQGTADAQSGCPKKAAPHSKDGRMPPSTPACEILYSHMHLPNDLQCSYMTSQCQSIK